MLINCEIMWQMESHVINTFRVKSWLQLSQWGLCHRCQWGRKFTLIAHPWVTLCPLIHPDGYYFCTPTASHSHHLKINQCTRAMGPRSTKQQLLSCQRPRWTKMASSSSFSTPHCFTTSKPDLFQACQTTKFIFPLLGRGDFQDSNETPSPRKSGILE